MGWLFVPELDLSTSACELQPEDATAWCVTSSGKPSLRALSWRGWKTRSWIKRLSGTILRPSMAVRGVGSWISSLRDCRANRTATPETGAGTKMNERSGQSSFASSGKSSPPQFFFENVAAYLRFYGPVWSELSSMGFVHAPPVLYTAHEKGAIHGRRRLFVLATHPDRPGLQGFARHVDRAPRRKGRPVGSPSQSHRTATYTVGQRTETGRDQPPVTLQAGEQDRREPEGRDCQAPYPESVRQHQSRNRSERRSGRDELERLDPVSTNANGERLALEWSGWVFDRERQTLRHNVDRCGDGCRICGSPWEAESPVLRMGDGYADWMVELRAIGNGVVPEMAAAAWADLMAAAQTGQ